MQRDGNRHVRASDAFRSETLETVELRAASLREKMARGDYDPAEKTQLRNIERILARLNTCKDCCAPDSELHADR